jgi:hypothetical protein
MQNLTFVYAGVLTASSYLKINNIVSMHARRIKIFNMLHRFIQWALIRVVTSYPPKPHDACSIKIFFWQIEVTCVAQQHRRVPVTHISSPHGIKLQVVYIQQLYGHVKQVRECKHNVTILTHLPE